MNTDHQIVELQERGDYGALVYERTPENDEFEAAWKRAGEAMREDIERSHEAMNYRPQRDSNPDDGALLDWGDLLWMLLLAGIFLALVFGLVE